MTENLFGFIGLCFLMIGISSEFIVLFYKYFLGEYFKDHIALLMFGIMLIVIGIQFFSMGLLGELLTRYTQGQENRIKKTNN